MLDVLPNPKLARLMQPRELLVNPTTFPTSAVERMRFEPESHCSSPSRLFSRTILAGNSSFDPSAYPSDEAEVCRVEQNVVVQRLTFGLLSRCHPLHRPVPAGSRPGLTARPVAHALGPAVPVRPAPPHGGRGVWRFGRQSKRSQI